MFWDSVHPQAGINTEKSSEKNVKVGIYKEWIRKNNECNTFYTEVLFLLNIWPTLGFLFYY